MINSVLLTNFRLLKQIFYILTFIVGLNFTSLAQNKPAQGGDVTAKSLKLYPIPATTVINFDFVSGYEKSLSFQIYNFTGKIVYELKNPPPKINLSVADFSRGFYYYKLHDKNGKLIETARFLVVK